MININPANFEHLTELKSMMAALYREDPGTFEFSPNKICNTLSFFTSHPTNGRILTINLNDTIIGYAILVYFWSNEYGGFVMFIDEFFIKPEYRNRGFGTKFFSQLPEFQPPNCVAWCLEHTADNTGASRLYHRLGFAPQTNATLIKLL
ncbi:hypothetical protein COT97_01775 [Candidatus Falkowbacteria bacterium CG10_big_fil_rev_8_21_14_0_10_39_11]|uniref:N-acetyltransferase domain-containing protein n=1 Tax=Candidatus Falkowbacteria bacterium CG10_big_fil_rev_8_21_14_0_10_39_11 TaxID=1974565 RepID=A0A2H0V5I5_9BACT|nr:MAG: hypothetical protein COT97_01775 [Candidatus Falkowbacteria bacterium CG10_big_fil_rev_8_21_14_0_10_39_11]